jgi:hypothetical protein
MGGGGAGACPALVPWLSPAAAISNGRPQSSQRAADSGLLCPQLGQVTIACSSADYAASTAFTAATPIIADFSWRARRNERTSLYTKYGSDSA